MYVCVGKGVSMVHKGRSHTVYTNTQHGVKTNLKLKSWIVLLQEYIIFIFIYIHIYIHTYINIYIYSLDFLHCMKFTGMHEFMHYMVFSFFFFFLFSCFRHPSLMVSWRVGHVSRVIICSSHAHVHREPFKSVSTKRLTALLCYQFATTRHCVLLVRLQRVVNQLLSLRMHYFIQPLST